MTIDHQTWLRKAHELADSSVLDGGSSHPRVKVGAVLVDLDGQEIACGSNRFPDGGRSDLPERFSDEERSHWMNCAEQMLLMDALRHKKDISGATLYVTLEPCSVCAGLIVQSGLRCVVVPDHAVESYQHLREKWMMSIRIGREKLREGGVKVEVVPFS